MDSQLGFQFDDSLNPPPEKPVETIPDKKEAFLEDWHEPTGVREVKRGSKVFYQYEYEKGAGRFVNTNRACGGCAQIETCYRGRHAYVSYCKENPYPMGK